MSIFQILLTNKLNIKFNMLLTPFFSSFKNLLTKSRDRETSIPITHITPYV